MARPLADLVHYANAAFMAGYHDNAADGGDAYYVRVHRSYERKAATVAARLAARYPEGSRDRAAWEQIAAGHRRRAGGYASPREE